MSQRTIDTILRLQGEDNYKAGLKTCSGELRVLKSELDLVASEFRTNANSMEALTRKGEVLSDMYAIQEKKMELLRGAMEKVQNTRDEEEQTVADLRAQYEAARKTLAAFGDEVDETSAEYQQQKAEVDRLRNAVIEHQAKVESSSKSYTYYSTQLNKAGVELNNLRDKQEENERLLEESRQSADKCATSIDRYGDAVRESAEATGESTSAVEAMATALVASGIQQKVEDLAASLMECSEAAQDFELGIAQVSTIADSAVLSVDDLRQGALELSTDLRKDANEVTEAIYNALSAGVETADVLSFTAQSSRLATAGFTDMGTSVDVLTTILNAYKMESSETEKVASTLVKTQDLGKITVDELGKVIGRVIPSAAAYGVNLDNIAAAYANMTAAGINAENTTTYLSTMLDELADSGSDVAEILKTQTGKTFAELMVSGSSLADVLEIIGASVEYDQVQFSNLWSSATAGKAAISLFDGSAAAFNATLEQMASSSGTVASNYEKMISVSEYSSQRLEVAGANLKIAVGTQLNPVLDQLRESGAGILEVATDIIAENPALVSVVAGTVTALAGLLSVLSGMMIVKSLTAAMAALNITMAANPAVLVTTAIVGLVAATATYLAQIETAAEKVESLTEASRTLAETVDAGNASYEDTVVSAEAAVDTVGRYIAQLAELEDQGVKTDAQQMEYTLLLEQIRALIPEINMELDAQTGLLKAGAESLWDQVDAWKENAIAEAAYVRYKSDVAALADAQYEAAKNQALLNMAAKEAVDLEEQYNVVQAKLIENYERSQTLNREAGQSRSETLAEISALADENARLDEELYALSVALRENAAQQEIYTQAIEKGNQAIADAEIGVAAATEAYGQMSQVVQNESEEAGDAVAEMADDIDAAALQAQEAYAEMYQSARESLDKQIGLFEDLSGKAEMTTAQMIERLLAQRKAFDEYATNIQLAMDRGINIGLVQTLADGSADSMLILAELVTGTDAQIAELNAAFAGVSEGKDNVAAAIADIDQVVQQEMAEAVTAAEEGARAVVDGLVSEVQQKSSKYAAAMAALAAAGQKAYRTENMIMSPSRKYRQLAAQDVQGLIVQYQADTPKVKTAAAQMADTGYLAQIRARQSAIPTVTAATQQAAAQQPGQDLYPMLQKILTLLQAGQRIVLYPDILVGRTAGAYDEVFGQTKILTDRGVY